MSLVRVRARFLLPDGTPAQGKVIFVPRPRLQNSLTGELVLSTEEFALDALGYLGSPLGVNLEAVDTPGLPPGLWYMVQFQIDDAEPVFGVLFVYEADAGTGIDLAGRVQFTVPPGPPSDFVLMSVFLAHVHSVGTVSVASHLKPDGTTIVADVDGTLHAVSGTGDKHYVHDQLSPATMWTILHNLNKHPSVTVVDSAGTEGKVRIEYPSLNVALVFVSAPFSGTAYCN